MMVFILSLTHYSSKYDFLRTCKSFGEEISRRRVFLLIMAGPRGKRKGPSFLLKAFIPP
jgi:hypothetical protein